jgi:Fic family protein
MYNWEQEDWLQFRFNESDFTAIALEFMTLAGRSQGFVQNLSTDVQTETLLTVLVREAIKTSAIEGEFLSREDLMSSIRRNLGFTESNKVKDKRAEGVVAMLVKARIDFAVDLTETQLFEWHTMLMMDNKQINAGQYRQHADAMQIVSGTLGKEIVHFEAPPSARVSAEMRQFITWFNKTKPNGLEPIKNPLIRAAVAHLYFETIHPFEDGNGRIGRVIAEKALAQGVNQPILLSLSSAIEADKKAYYTAFKEAQQTNDLTNWIRYFAETVLKAQRDFLKTIDFLIKKTIFFDKYQQVLNDAQLKVIHCMFENGEDEFQGGMNARKYQSISRVSKATATRHLQDLLEKGILISKGGGRSTNYQLNLG